MNYTPEISGWNPKMEVDGSNDFPFQTGDVQVSAVKFPGCGGKATKWIQHGFI